MKNDAEKLTTLDDVERTLKNLEHWFGPYPFYKDGYQIVDAPHLGMEHQSAIALKRAPARQRAWPSRGWRRTSRICPKRRCTTNSAAPCRTAKS